MRNVLVVDDDLASRELLRKGLSPAGFDVSSAPSADEALRVLNGSDVGVVLTDVNMPGSSGIELCRRVAELHPDVPTIVVTGFGSLQTAVEAMRAGAYDFITKPFDLDAVGLAIERALRHRELRDEVRRLRLEVSHARPATDLLGSSAPMLEVQRLISRVADTDMTVLVTGESGTGKELVARALHEASRRSAGPFVALNCAALPEQLLESELFGHARGAFTDARSSRAGLFAEANGGVLFLDEIGEMPLGLQPKLLRALEQRAVRPVGASGEVAFDVRVVAATNRDIETAVAEGRFREDLFYRVNTITIELPPLRSRGADVLMLAQHFLERATARLGKPVVGLSAPAAEKLAAYAWPGNVRELRNCVDRAVALTAFDQIGVADLPAKVRDFKTNHVLVVSDDPAELVPLEEVERRYILRVLDTVGGNKSMAARVLGLNRKTLYRKLEAYGIAAD